MSGFNQSNRNLILSCYATFLAQGNTLLCRSIKAKTIREYLFAACLFSEQIGLSNPKIDIYGKECRLVREILHEVARWEEIPNMHEPFTWDIVDYIITKGKNTKLKIIFIPPWVIGLL